jgi:hypothetical protein
MPVTDVCIAVHGPVLVPFISIRVARTLCSGFTGPISRKNLSLVAIGLGRRDMRGYDRVGTCLGACPNTNGV